MAKSLLTLDEAPSSPDLFSESDKESSPGQLDSPNFEEFYPCAGKSEPEPMDDSPEWKGMSMDDIHKGLGPFGHHQHPPIHPSESHTVLFQLPIPNRGPLKPYPTQAVDKWGVGFVRMPNSPSCRYPIEKENNVRKLRIRWEVIQEALLQSFMSSIQLEAAILSYNSKYAEKWSFPALHHFLTEAIDEEEAEMFFENLLPKMIQLALQLPTLITGPIPLLLQHTNSAISLSQLQVASLLANAFFCTFPRRNSYNPQAEYGLFPHINFNRLFAAFVPEKTNQMSVIEEKFKCIFHYFRRVTTAVPEGTITIQRRYIPKEDCPRWDKIHKEFPPLHITSKGTIETEGAGLLQVDFANKFVGGGVLHFGCVQEEIRFLICPELLVTMLVTEVLDDTEALIISGVERYSDYEGYAQTFRWTGDFIDETPHDNSRRRKTSVVAIDALHFMKSDQQFYMKNIIRELNKAFVGFSSSEIPNSDLSAVATGNWGCGAFRGDPKLKVLIQLMAAAVTGRPIVYFTFGDKTLQNTIADMYWHLVNRNVDVARLFTLLHAYTTGPLTGDLDFYSFLYNRSKIKPLTSYFSVIKNKLDITVTPGKKKSTIDDTNQCTIEKNNKSTTVQRNLRADELEEEQIRKLLENYDDDDVETTINPSTSIKKSPSTKADFETKLEDNCIAETPSEKRLTSLEILGRKPENYKDPLIITTVKTKSPRPSGTNKPKNKSMAQVSGQKKIIDFFSRKNS